MIELLIFTLTVYAVYSTLRWVCHYNDSAFFKAIANRRLEEINSMNKWLDEYRDIIRNSAKTETELKLDNLALRDKQVELSKELEQIRTQADKMLRHSIEQTNALQTLRERVSRRPKGMKTVPGQLTHHLGLLSKTLTTEQFQQIKRWIKALKSGHYAQGTNRLFRKENNTYCCLGVANKVCNLGDDSTRGTLSNVSALSLGLRDQNGSFYRTNVTEDGKVSSTYSSLTTLNDSEDWSFNEIAQLLEDQLLFSEVVDA